MDDKNYALRVDTRTGNILAMEFFAPVSNPYTNQKDVILYFIKLEDIENYSDFSKLSALELENLTEFLWHKYYTDVKGMGELREFDFESRKNALKNVGQQPIDFITSKDSLENIINFLEKENVLNKIEIKSIVNKIFEPTYTKIRSNQ